MSEISAEFDINDVNFYKDQELIFLEEQLKYPTNKRKLDEQLLDDEIIILDEINWTKKSKFFMNKKSK